MLQPFFLSIFNGSSVVRTCFGCGSGVARMWLGCGSEWFGHGSDMARVWFGCGSDVVRVWFGCGSGMVWVGPAYIYVLFCMVVTIYLNFGLIEPKHVQYANNLKKVSVFL